MLNKDTRNTNQIKKWSKIIFVRATDIQGMIHCAVNLSKQADNVSGSLGQFRADLLDYKYATVICIPNTMGFTPF